MSASSSARTGGRTCAKCGQPYLGSCPCGDLWHTKSPGGEVADASSVPAVPPVHALTHHGMSATCSCGLWSITADEAPEGADAAHLAHVIKAVTDPLYAEIAACHDEIHELTLDHERLIARAVLKEHQ